MNDKKEKKFYESVSKCDKCGKEYSKYLKIEKGEVVQEGYYPNCKCLVEIKLKKYQIPILLGAANLGAFIERQCFHVVKALGNSNTYIQRSNAWDSELWDIEKAIKEQTKIDLYYSENGEIEGIIEYMYEVIKERIELIKKKSEEFKSERSKWFHNFKLEIPDHLYEE